MTYQGKMWELASAEYAKRLESEREKRLARRLACLKRAKRVALAKGVFALLLLSAFVSAAVWGSVRQYARWELETRVLERMAAP